MHTVTAFIPSTSLRPMDNTGCSDQCMMIADKADELDSTARRKFKKKTKPPSSALSVKSSRPVQLSATDVAKGAMTLQEPQLLDKMQNAAYRLEAQAHERKKHMNSRYPFTCPTVHV